MSAHTTPSQSAEDYLERIHELIEAKGYARVVDIARALIGDLQIPTTVTGIRPGEKIHEVMVSQEEAYRTVRRGGWYAIRPMLPEVYHLPYPMPYHGVTLEHSLQALEQLFKADVDPARVAAIIIEPVLGEGGFYAAPSEFLQAVVVGMNYRDPEVMDLNAIRGGAGNQPIVKVEGVYAGFRIVLEPK